MEYLDLEDLLRLVRALRAGPVRDLGLLDAAAARPRSSACGEDAYPTLALKAAALLHSLARNHALVDGNKRLGWLATGTFLELNGVEVAHVPNDDVYDFVIGVAAGKHDVLDIAGQLERLVMQRRTRRPRRV